MGRYMGEKQKQISISAFYYSEFLFANEKMQMRIKNPSPGTFQMEGGG